VSASALFPTAKCCINRRPVVLIVRASITLAHEGFGERIMTEIENLTNLRDKLVIRRRSLVEALQKAPPQRLSGESIMQIQSAIESVDRAIEDERSSQNARPRAVPVS
jgi:hypothetical protein